MRKNKQCTTSCLKPKVHSSSREMQLANKPMEESAEEQILKKFGDRVMLPTKEGFLLRIITPQHPEKAIKSIKLREFLRKFVEALIMKYEESLINKGYQEAAKVFEQVDLKPIADDARRSAEAAEKNGAKLDELSKWLKDWRKNGPKIDANNPPRTTDASMVREKIMKLWKEYKKNPEPITRKRGQQPSYEEFIQYKGDTIVHEGKTLFDLLQIAKKPSENALHKTLARLLNSTSRNKKRHS